MSEKPCVLLTAAGSGIGAACARELAARGYDLVLMSRSESAAKLATELGGCGLQGSVTVPGDLERLVNLALEANGRIDGAVVNTGHAPWMTDPTGRRFDPDASGSLLEIADQDWHAALDLYLLHVVRLARLLAPLLERQGGGAIVNISAFAAAEPNWMTPMSSVIRPCLAGFRKLFADRLGAANVRMHDVMPGYIDNWEWSPELKRSIPMGRPGTPQEIARVVAFLLSQDASYLTGQGLLVDGGVNRGA